MGESGAATGGAGGGGGISKVGLALTVLLACLMAAAFFYLQVSAGVENEALRARIEALDRRLAALSEAVVQLNNKTHELIRRREEEQRRTYKDEEEVETDAEYEDDMDTEYDDPNEDDSEYEEEEEEDYDHKEGATNKDERRSKRSSGRSTLTDATDLRIRHGMEERRHSRSRRFQKMRRLRIADETNMSAKQKDSIFEEKYPVIQRNRRNNRREDVEVFTQNMTPLSSELIAAHFGADETKCLNQPHLRHCDSNHRRYHPGGIIKDWNTIFTSSSSTLNMREGKLTINSAGVYFVYAQVFYSNAHDVNSFRVVQNEQSIMQCTTYSSHNSNSAPRRSCFTGALAYLSEGDQLHVRDVEERRHTLFEKTKTFFGLFKVGNTLTA